MRFVFSRYNLNKKEKFVQRVFEIMPGAVSWSIILGMFILSFLHPLTAAIIIISFDFYWIIRLFYMTLFLSLSYYRLSIEAKTDWMIRIKGLKDIRTYIEDVKNSSKPERFKRRFSRFLHCRELKSLISSKIDIPNLDEIYHLVIIPVVKETRDIVEPGIKSIGEGLFPSGRIIIVFALEQRAPAPVKQGIRGIQDKYKNNFFDVLIVEHKDGVPGEYRVKGANATNAAKYAASYLKSKGIAFENVISSCFDSDTVINPGYFACLTYHFLICPFRHRASFQPIPVYHNNIWDVPGFARVLEAGSSFFQLIEATNPESLVTFSSHSMSFKALVEVGYWPVDMISDDSAIFWKSYIYYDGDYRVVPMYTTVSMDIVAADSWWKTIVNEYKQKRRWAWGVENIPIVMRGFIKNKKISSYHKMRLSFKLFEGHVAWATWAFLLTIIGWLPTLFAGSRYHETVLYYSVPRITGAIFNLSSFSLIICIILSIRLLPKNRSSRSILKKIRLAIQWLTIPFIAFFLSAIPALDAQSRLMFGRRMEFWVADKKRNAG